MLKVSRKSTRKASEPEYTSKVRFQLGFSALHRAIAMAMIAGILAGQPTWANPDPALNLPNIGDRSEQFITPLEERRLGEAFMRSIRRSLTILDDPQITGYIQSLGYKLVAHSDRRAEDYTFFVVEDPSINAFAGPGGYIGVNTGLILGTSGEDELAAVLAHELAHISQRHLSRTFEAVSKMSLPTAAGVIAGIILGSIDEQLGQAAIAATAATSLQTQINFTRANEAEADRVGIQTLAAAGFDPEAMARFFERLNQVSRFNESSVPDFLRTHPVTIARVADARNRAAQYQEQSRIESLAYHLAKAKIRVSTSNDQTSNAAFFAERMRAERGDAGEAARYGYALALHAAGQHQQALTALQPLLEEAPGPIAYLLAAADIHLAARSTDMALSLLAEGLAFHPNNYPLTHAYAKALLTSHQAKKARVLLQNYLSNQSVYPGVYELLAQADAELGMTMAAHRSLAEYYYLTGRTDTAIEQLRIALTLVGSTDTYHRALIEARLKELQTEFAALGSS